RAEAALEHASPAVSHDLLHRDALVAERHLRLHRAHLRRLGGAAPPLPPVGEDTRRPSHLTRSLPRRPDRRLPRRRYRERRRRVPRDLLARTAGGAARRRPRAVLVQHDERALERRRTDVSRPVAPLLRPPRQPPLRL